MTLNAFTINGMYATEASKTFTVTNALTVGANAGNVAGALVVTDSTTLVAGSVVNNGTIGGSGGTTPESDTESAGGDGPVVTRSAGHDASLPSRCRCSATAASACSDGREMMEGSPPLLTLPARPDRSSAKGAS